MKKAMLLILMSVLVSIGYSQKISPNNYKNVDSLIQYDNATIVVYKDKSGKMKRDIIYSKNQKSGINIESADAVIIIDKKYKNGVHITTVNQTGGQTAEIIINNK